MCGLCICSIIHSHGAKLQAGEYVAILAMTFLTEQYGTRGGAFDSGPNDQKNEWKESAEKKYGYQQIEASLERQTSCIHGQIASFRMRQVP